MLIIPELCVLVLTQRHVGSGNEIAIARFMAHALNTFYCRGALGTRVNPDTIGWKGEFDLTHYVWAGKFLNLERKSCGLKNIGYVRTGP